jgi:Cellulase (glycosyl hydrolase family 5)
MGRRPPPAHAAPGRRVLTLPLAIGLLAVLGAGAGGASWAASHRGAAGVTGSPAGARPLAETRKPASAQAAACHHEKGPFQVSGTVVTGSTGRYIPYGINLTGLAHPNYADQMAQDEADIAGAADDWCANTVRFQVRQANLVSITGHVNQAFLNAVTTEVHFAEASGLVVVLNLQWQLDDAKLVESMPTRRSEAFWGSLASHFGTDPNVVFDIFNEPAQRAPCGWAFWHNGGVCRGHRYLGMQALADYVRARASNLFWVEGISAGSLLNEAWRYHITGDGPLEYSEHRPPGVHQYRTWDSEFGYIARSGHAPVVEGEWADYARGQAPWACWDNAPVSAPRFLKYLQARGFGLIMTRLVKGQLIETGNLNDPTRFRSNWSCTDGLDQGVGQQAQQWFVRQNG